MTMERPPISRGLEDFLAWLRNAEERYHIAEAEDQEANDGTQDLLHRLELAELTTGEAEAVARTLGSVRRRRREAKVLLEQTRPVMDWLESNRRSVKLLERTLGEVRKAERRSQDRIYTPKTKILEELELCE